MRLRLGSWKARFWARAFLKNCRRAMKPAVDDVKAVDADIRRAMQALFDQGVGSLPDEQARMILVMCASVLAAYRTLKTRLGDSERAFEIVRGAFAKTLPGPMTWWVRLWMWTTRDPVAYLQRRSLARIGERSYGKSMEFAEDQTADSASFLVTRCAFHQYFVDHGEPDLTPLVCAWDRAWMDAIDRSSRPVRTERPSTISTGGDCCRFQFIRDDQKAGKDTNDVVLVQLGAREPANVPPS